MCFVCVQCVCVAGQFTGIFQSMGVGGYERMQPGWEDSRGSNYYQDENDMGNWDGSQDSNSSWGSGSTWNRQPQLRGGGGRMSKVLLPNCESLPSLVLGHALEEL